MINPTAPIPGLDSRGWLGVTRADGGGWRRVAEDEEPLPSSIHRPAGSIASGLTVLVDGALQPVMNGLRPTGEVFATGEYSDAGFWHRLIGEAEPISHRLGIPRPCPAHGEREPVETRGAGWVYQVWQCPAGATDGSDDARCPGRLVDAQTGRILRGMSTAGTPQPAAFDRLTKRDVDTVLADLLPEAGTVLRMVADARPGYAATKDLVAATGGEGRHREWSRSVLGPLVEAGLIRSEAHHWPKGHVLGAAHPHGELITETPIDRWFRGVTVAS